VTAVRGIDISPNMVEEYNQRAAGKGRSPTQMRAVVGDVFATPPDPAIADHEFFGFDFAVISGALHHMPDAALTLQKLADHLKTGGTLLVFDFLPDPIGTANSGHAHGHSHGHDHGHSHSHGSAPVVDLGDGPSAIDDRQALKTITKHGFSKDEMNTLLSGAGYTDFDFKEVKETFRFGGSGAMSGKERRVFLCRSKKA
jgi:SAM-dependent methyltransferase